jgi:hypothetical protein
MWSVHSCATAFREGTLEAGEPINSCTQGVWIVNRFLGPWERMIQRTFVSVLGVRSQMAIDAR